MQSKDAKYGKVSEKLTKGMIGNVRLIEKLNNMQETAKNADVRKELKELVRMALQNIQMGALAVHSLNQLRRSDLRGDLHHSYKALCNPPEEESTEFFVADLSRKVKERRSRKAGKPTS